jgi:hypothetical protein
MAASTFSPQQLVLRFGPEGRLAEVRVRYQEIPKKATETNLTLLNRLRKEGGEPNVLTPTWIGLWTDMPASAVIPVYNLWQDDRTRLTYQADPLCSEVILTDCPLDRPDGVALPPLETCTRGIDGARLGDSRAEVESRWKQDQTRPLTDGGLVLFMPSSSPYDMTIVYFDNNKVNRVLARHRLAPTDARGYLADLQKVWHNDVDRLGVLRRVDSRVDPETGDQIPIGFSWNDDVTRVRAFGTKAADGSHRLFTEWRAWPIPVEKKASTTRK